MSVRQVTNNGYGNATLAAKGFPAGFTPVTTPWVRNPSWPACEANAGDNKIVGLYAVWPYGGNFFAVTISGAYTIDYGDGTTTNYTSGATAYYEFDYNDADLSGTDAPVTFTASTDTVNRTAHGYTDGMTVQFYNIATTTGVSNAQVYYVINATANTFQVSATKGGSAIDLVNDGSATLLPYKIATVTITPQAGNNLTNISFLVKHNQASLVSGYSTGWLDVAVACGTITAFTIGSSSTTVRYTYLERVRLNELGSITSFNSLFRNCYSLRDVHIANTITTVTSTLSMFQNCSSLTESPFFNTSSVTDMGLMFSGCYSLKEVPSFDTSFVTNAITMFANCYSLTKVPFFNTSSVANMSSMFSSCYSLEEVPLFDTSSVINMSSMFASCHVLKSVPLFNTSSVTNMSSMFSTCYSITELPLLDTSSVTNMSSMFSNCSSLEEVPLFDTSSVTDMSNMFRSCYSLVKVPLLDTSSVTTMQSMFQGCQSLKNVPLFNTVSLGSMNSMFRDCYSLVEIPSFNTASVVNFGGAFLTCYSLAYVPEITTTAVTSSTAFSNMFGTCPSLASIKAKEFNYTFSVANCKLSSAALDEIYTNLPTVTGQTITVSGNYGTTGDDPTIATAKGWTVTG